MKRCIDGCAASSRARPTPARTACQSASVPRNRCRYARVSRRIRATCSVTSPAAFRMQHHDAAGEAILERRLERAQVGPRPERRRRQQQLDVRFGEIGAALEERNAAAGHVRGETGAEQIRFRELTPDAVVAHHGQERSGLAAVVHQDRPIRDPEDCGRRRGARPSPRCRGAAAPRVAHTRQHQQLRRVDDPAREDDFAACASAVRTAPPCRYSMPLARPPSIDDLERQGAAPRRVRFGRGRAGRR